MKYILALLLLCTCASCATHEHRMARRVVEQSPAEADIREAVFRYQFLHNASGQQQQASAYFLSIGERGGVPSEDFMKRFADHNPPVKPATRSSFSMQQGVVDRDTGKSGLLFFAGAIKWISKTEVEVSGGYSEAAESASGNVYFVEQRDGKWVVTGDKILWIS